jgi:outer membrane lipase/esterase
MNLLANLTRLNRTARCAIGAVSLAVLAACGGGDRVEEFQPTRLLVFGDETSVIDDSASPGNGRKYTVNSLNAEGDALDCSASAIWTQYLVATFSLPLPQCNPTGVADPASRIHAANAATVADLATQVDAHLASDSFGNRDLVTVLVGANDILAQYALYDGTNEAALIETVEALGTEVANQVNRIATLGGRVIVSTVPDMGLTPFANTEETANPGRAELLSRLTAAFNVELRSNLINDGRMIGLVLADEMVQTLVRYPGAFGIVNVTEPVCDPAKAATVFDCTVETLVTDGNAGTWLWADATHFSPLGQRYLGQLAQSRATNNPF